MIPADSPSWVPARVGCLTASRMKDAMDFLKGGKPSEARRKYMIDLVAERLSGVAVDHYVTPAMEHGLTFEPAAKEAYEIATGDLLLPAGFILHPTIDHWGCTPDALLGADGLAEFKCPTTAKHIAWMLAGVVPDEHKPQMLAQLVVTGRRFCMFASYDPRVPPKQRLFVRRFEPTAEEREHVTEAAVKFLAEVDAMFEAVSTAEMIA